MKSELKNENEMKNAVSELLVNLHTFPNGKSNLFIEEKYEVIDISLFDINSNYLCMQLEGITSLLGGDYDDFSETERSIVHDKKIGDIFMEVINSHKNGLKKTSDGGAMVWLITSIDCVLYYYYERIEVDIEIKKMIEKTFVEVLLFCKAMNARVLGMDY